MESRVWGNEYRTTLVCVDSYQDGVLAGRFFNPYRAGEDFQSLSQFLLKMELLLDEMKLPQSHTAARSFAAVPARDTVRPPPSTIQEGALATFKVQVIFRQHSSWQGVIVWLEKGKEQSFRSVLELILLMDSALRETEAEGKPLSPAM